MRFHPVALAVSTVLSLNGGAYAIEMTDYKDPQSSWEEAFLTGSFNSKSGNQDQTSYDLTLDAFYEHNYSSLPRTWQIHVDGEADVTRGADQGDRSEDNSVANFRANLDNYFASRPNTFWFGENEINYRSDADNLRAEVGIGLGYGRVINATPLAKVLRIEEELREHGVILGRMSDDEYLELAQIIDLENEYRGKYGADEYKSVWIADFEKVLKRIGVLKNGSLGALGVLQMHKVLFDEPVSIRKHGWLVRAGVGYVVQNFEGDESDPSVGITYEYAHPSGYKGQFINRLDYSTVLGDDTLHYITNDMSYSHEISDRIDWINQWTLDWQIFDDEREDITRNGLSTTFRYYLTNRVTANATLSVIHTEDGIPDSEVTEPDEFNDETDVTTFFSIAYRLK